MKANFCIFKEKHDKHIYWVYKRHNCPLSFYTRWSKEWQESQSQYDSIEDLLNYRKSTNNAKDEIIISGECNSTDEVEKIGKMCERFYNL